MLDESQGEKQSYTQGHRPSGLSVTLPTPTHSPHTLHHNHLLLLSFSPILSLALIPGPLTARQCSTADSTHSLGGWSLGTTVPLLVTHTTLVSTLLFFHWPSLHNMKRRDYLLHYTVIDTVKVSQWLSSWPPFGLPPFSVTVNRQGCNKQPYVWCVLSYSCQCNTEISPWK